MSDQPTVRGPQSADGHGGLRLLALAAVALGVLLLAAAAFVLSYAGIHAVALAAGVSPRLARIYPLIFDAMLVVAGAAVLALRSAGLPSRSYAWLSMLALLATAAAADALHATGTRLPRRPAAATAAVIPWALVLIGFGLLLCMLRQARLRRAAAAVARPVVAAGPSGHVTVRSAIVSPPGPDAATNSDGAAGTAPPSSSPAADLASDLTIDAEPGPDDPTSDEAAPTEQPQTARIPRARNERPAGHGSRQPDRSAAAFRPAPTLTPADDALTDGAMRRTTADAIPGLEPSAESEPVTEAELSREPEALAEFEPEALAEPEPAAEAEAMPAAEAEAAPGATSGPEGEAEPETEPAPGAGSAPAAEAVPTAPHFDRMRSSPVPPEA
jgi:hypothetical protein